MNRFQQQCVASCRDVRPGGADRSGGVSVPQRLALHWRTSRPYFRTSGASGGNWLRGVWLHSAVHAGVELRWLRDTAAPSGDPLPRPPKRHEHI